MASRRERIAARRGGSRPLVPQGCRRRQRIYYSGTKKAWAISAAWLERFWQSNGQFIGGGCHSGACCRSSWVAGRSETRQGGSNRTPSGTRNNR
jgi:hypothetical protein